MRIKMRMTDVMTRFVADDAVRKILDAKSKSPHANPYTCGCPECLLWGAQVTDYLGAEMTRIQADDPELFARLFKLAELGSSNATLDGLHRTSVHASIISLMASA
jgi:hypothetical protein